MKLIRVSLWLVLLGTILTLSSCGKKDKPISIVKFTSAQASYAEDIGAISVGVTISPVQSQDVTVNYTWTSPDTTAFLGADFTYVTPSSITISAGQTSGNIQIQAIDDTQIDGDNNLTLTLSGTSTNASLTNVANDKEFDLTITDNDVVPANKLQVDLYWFGTSPTANINDQDLDLYLQDSVVYTRDGNNNVIIGTGTNDQGKTFTSSIKATGFETLFLNSTDLDQKYFLYVVYQGGAGAVNFAMELNGLGRSNDFLTGSFDASAAPSTANGVFFAYAGPFLKAGSVFDFTNSRRVPASQIKIMKAKLFKQ